MVVYSISSGCRCGGWAGGEVGLILGRHTWEEYIRYLHKGWLNPLDPSAENPADLSTETTLELPDPIPQDGLLLANPPPSDLSNLVYHKILLTQNNDSESNDLM